MTEVSLAEALRQIPAKRTGDAYLAITLACFYLRTGLPIPHELRSWLDAYLTNERRQMGKTSVRALRMSNLAVILDGLEIQKRATGRGKINLEIAEFERKLGLGESTAKKWRTKNKKTYEANAALGRHLNELIQALLSLRGEK
jgi:hypothetical protein